MRLNIWIIALLVISLTGCSATGPVFKEEAAVQVDKALIYVYRPSALFNAGGYPNLYVNGRDLGPLYNGGYIPVVTAPGKTNLVLKGEFSTWGMQKPIGIALDAIAGKKHFVRFGNEITSFFAVPGAGFYGSRIVIQEAPEEFAKGEIANTNLSVDSAQKK